MLKKWCHTQLFFFHYSQGSFLCFVDALLDCVELFTTQIHIDICPMKGILSSVCWSQRFTKLGLNLFAKPSKR